jgi:type VI secretion system protein ImpD
MGTPESTLHPPADETVLPSQGGASLLDRIVQTAVEPVAAASSGFLAGGPSLASAVRYYQDRVGAPPRTKDDLIGLVSRDIADLDSLLAGQINAVLHHPRFQQLEAAWRGLDYLVRSAEGGENVRIVVLHLPKRELATDLQNATEFDQSQLFAKVQAEEFGTAGGHPFGVLVADYGFRNTPADVDLLEKIAEVAAAAFAPFIAGVEPQMFGIGHFGLLERVADVGAQFNGLQFVKWNALREKDDARFLGLSMPRILMRLPYDRDSSREEEFLFSEDVAAPDRSGYLWGNAAWAFGALLIEAFVRSGWFADIRGTNQGPGAGGVVDGLPAPWFVTDRPGVALKPPVETMIGEYREKELSDLGFIALCDCEDTPYAAFFANPSIQKPKVYDDPLATANARISAMLQYVLCASRFAHYLNVIARDKVGRFTEAKALERQLHSWIQQFVAVDPGASPATRAKFPLQAAKIEIRDHPRDPGHFLAELYLSPHLQLDELTASVRLVSEIRKD